VGSFSLNTLKDFMATIANQKKKITDNISHALSDDKMHAKAIATLEMLQGKLAANELSTEIISALADESLSALDFDGSGRWTRADTVGGYRPKLSKRRKTEDTVFEVLQTTLSQSYEADGLSGVLLAMRKVTVHLEDCMWSDAVKSDAFKLELELSVAVAAADKRSKSGMKKYRASEDFVAGLEQLDVLLNGAIPKKKAPKSIAKK
jgi:hypothetical protein